MSSPNSTYENVVFGKSEGTVTLSASDFIFKSAGGKALKLPHKTIEKHQMNPKSHTKALLKLMFQNDKPARLFQLPTREDLERISADLTTRLKEVPPDGPKAKVASSNTGIKTGEDKGGVYQGVHFRSMEGTLHILENQLKFEPKDDASKSVTATWSTIAKQQMSPAKIAKCMLKLTKQDDKILTFQVSSRSELESLNRDVEKRRKQTLAPNKEPAKSTTTKPTPKAAAKPAAASTNSERTETSDGSVYSNITFKSITGTLTLTQDSMAFQSTGPKKVSKTVRWNRVSKCQGNPPSHAKVLLKVFLTDDSPILLQLAGRPMLKQLQDDITAKLIKTAESAKSGQDDKGLGQLSALKGAAKETTEDDAHTVHTKFVTSSLSKASALPIVFEGVKHGEDMGRLTLTQNDISFQKSDEGNETKTSYPWSDVFKHQCSPPKIPKALLKLVLTNEEKPLTFQLADRKDLDKIRRDIAVRLQEFQHNQQPPSTADNDNKLEAISEVPATEEKVESSTEQSEKATSEPSPKNDSTEKEADKSTTDLPEDQADKSTTAQVDSVEADEGAADEEESTKESSTKDQTKTRTKSQVINGLLSLASSTRNLGEEQAEASAGAAAEEKSTKESSTGDEVKPESTKESSTQDEAKPEGTEESSNRGEAKSRTKSEVITDLLSLASIGSDGSDEPATEKRQADDSTAGLLAIASSEPQKNSVEQSSIFDDDFAADTGYSMMFDDDSDDDFSVVTTDTRTAESKNATALPVDYKDVSFRSMTGMATLSKDNLLFQPDETLHPGEQPTKIMWDSVERHHGSPPKHDKAVLKIFLSNGKSVTFTMSTRKDLELIRMDLTSRLHEYRKSNETKNFASSALEGLVIGKSSQGVRSADGYIPNYKKLPPGAKKSSAYHPVHHEQCEGSLFLSWDQLSFQPSGLGDVDKAHAVFWDAIEGHGVSEEKPILNITLQDGSTLDFRFPNRRELEKCDKDAGSRLSSYDEFENVSPQKQQPESSDKERDPPERNKAPPKQQGSFGETISVSNRSMLDISGSSISEDFEDEDLLFGVNGLPPPPPPPIPPGGIPVANNTLESNSSHSSSSSSSSSNSGSSSSSGGSGSGSDAEENEGNEATDESEKEAT